MFASFPDSNEPMLSPRFNEYAALIVAALIASAGDIFICVQASERTIGIDGVGDEPGLKSVASTTASPASIISRPRGYVVDPSAQTDPAKRTGCTIAGLNSS